MIEANPRIITFCERPTYVDGPRGPVIDFWVQLSDDPDGEFWIIEGLERQQLVRRMAKRTGQQRRGNFANERRSVPLLLADV